MAIEKWAPIEEISMADSFSMDIHCPVKVQVPIEIFLLYFYIQNRFIEEEVFQWFVILKTGFYTK